MRNIHGAGLLLVLSQLGGCGGQMVGWELEGAVDSGVGPDETAPTVILTVPSDLATGVALDAAMAVTFSERMESDSINTSTVQVVAPDSTTVAGAVYYASGSEVATFVPTVNLMEGAEYTATVTTGAMDRSGNTLAENYVWTFTTDGTGIDVTPPTVILTDPADLAVAVALNSLVEVTFSEAMDTLTINSSTVDVAMADGTRIPGAVYYDVPTRLATFVPDDQLVADEMYTGSVSTGATDLAGNALGADYVWSFTTDDSSIDVTPPIVTFTDPDDLQVGVVLNTVVEITFSEGMDELSLDTSTIELFAPDSSAVLGAVYYDALAHVVTFVPDVDLVAGSTYEGTVTTGTMDMAGNNLAADYVWTFTTDDSSIDVIPPTVLVTDPLDLATDVAVGTLVEATFSEAMDPLTLTTATFELVAPDLTTVPATVFYDAASMTASLVPDDVLLGESTYTATVTSGAADSSGITMVSDYSWSFTTADVTAPMVILTDPEDLALDVAVDTTVEFTFDEDMDDLTITTANFELVAPDATTVAGVLTFDPLTRVGTFVPDDDLFDGDTYIATVTTGVTDLAGNPLAYDYSWSFTTHSDVWALDPVELGSLTTFVAVAGAGLTNSNSAGTTNLGGDVGLSPTGTCIGDGVPCTLTNPVITGTLYVMDVPAAQAQTDLTAAYVDAMSRPRAPSRMTSPA